MSTYETIATCIGGNRMYSLESNGAEYRVEYIETEKGITFDEDNQIVDADTCIPPSDNHPEMVKQWFKNWECEITTND